jgi:predicted  nucleic acid-binding Zn-ribbon protein
MRTENQRLRDDLERARLDSQSSHDLVRAREEELREIRESVPRLREENESLRSRLQQQNQWREAAEHSERNLEELRAAYRSEQVRADGLQDEIDRLRAEITAAEVERREVTVEREGMRARADLLRRVYENHKAVAGALKNLRGVRSSDTYLKMKNSTRDPSPKEIVAEIESAVETLQRTITTSTHIIKTYFTNNEKLTCGMSAEWYKNEAGKPRAIDEKVITTTVTTRSASPTGNSPTHQTSPHGSPAAYHGGSSYGRGSPTLPGTSPAYRSTSPQNANANVSSNGRGDWRM